MFASDANAVLEMYQEKTPEMTGRWHDVVDDDPFKLVAAILLGIDKVALEYIEANIPNAWFKPMFEK